MGGAAPRGRIGRRLGSIAGAGLAAAAILVGAAGAATSPPNDPSFPQQWALRNTGQVVSGITGTPGADEDVLPAWGLTTGSRSIVVAIADTGVDYRHPDLLANLWKNPGGVGGCAAGTFGFNVVDPSHPTCDPKDTDTTYKGHGTHVAGIVGAVGNNGVGVSGVNWQTTLLPVKFLNDNGNSSTMSSLVTALQKIVALKQAGLNVRVVNVSPTFPGIGYSQALSDAIAALGQNDILFVTAAGNTAQDNDTTPRYPCDYGQPNELCVAMTNSNDQLDPSSNWGPGTVDLAAPGSHIYSTLRTDKGSYGTITGTSMAAAEVSGAAALILAANPTMSVADLKATILDNVRPIPALAGKVRTGGILDVCSALPGCELPVNTAAPTISGTAQAGQQLTASTGSWRHVPTSYSYLWTRCDQNGASCASTGIATSTYALGSGDVGHTLRVAVTASNQAGSSSATSAATATVAPAPPTTFGTTTVGANAYSFVANFKRANPYQLTVAGSVSKLTIYLQPTAQSGTQTLRGFIYTDAGGVPGSLVATTAERVFSSSSAAGWYDLTFASPVHLAPGTYWLGTITGATSGVIGFRYTPVPHSRLTNANSYAAGPSASFGTGSPDNQEMSLYATYTPS